MKTYAQELASLPADWTVAPLASLGAIIGGSTPSRIVPRYWGGTIPWVSPGELTDLKTTYLYETRDRITPEGLASCGTSVLPAYSLLVTTRATIGSVILTAMPTATNQGFKSIVFRSAVPCFYYYAIGRIRRELERRSSGTTFLEISGRDFAGTNIVAPSILEQRQIAEILQTVDEALRRTEQIVEKLKLAKQGLLHDLLTRGIDDNGELRDPIRHPAQFKDSPLGRIPRSWNAHALASFVPGAVYGGSEALSAGPGIPVLRMNNIKDGEAELTEVKFSDHPCYHRLLLRNGDVLFNRTNSLEHVGRTGIWRGQIETASFASYLVRLDPDPKRLTGEFLNRLLNWGPTQTRIRRVATPGVQQVNINPTNLRRTVVVVPGSISEQTEIVARLDALDKSIRAEESDSAKLRLLKQALMDDLLTGRVRTTPLLEKDFTP